MKDWSRQTGRSRGELGAGREPRYFQENDFRIATCDRRDVDSDKVESVIIPFVMFFVDEYGGRSSVHSIRQKNVSKRNYATLVCLPKVGSVRASKEDNKWGKAGLQGEL